LQLRTGSLLVAHPVHAKYEFSEKVIYITESTDNSTVGLILNSESTETMKTIMLQNNTEWGWNQKIFDGGEFNRTAMVMLHSDNWYSRNTIQVNNDLSISSDELMIDKMAMGDFPDWHRLFIGCSGWTPSQLENEVRKRKPEWLVLAYPSRDLIESNSKSLWNKAVAEVSQDFVTTFF